MTTIRRIAPGEYEYGPLRISQAENWIWYVYDTTQPGSDSLAESPTLRDLKPRLDDLIAATQPADVGPGDTVTVATNPDSPSGEQGWDGAKVIRIQPDGIAVVTKPGQVGVRTVSASRLTRSS